MAVQSEKLALKKERNGQRELEQKKQEQRMKWLIAATGVIAIVVIAAAFIFAPKPQQPQQPQQAAFDYASLPILGKADAPVKIVEFGDFKCPSCKYFSEQIKPTLVKDYVDNGTVALYFTNNTFIGPDSFAAAMAGQSIYHQNNNEFWKFYDAIYKYQGPETIQWATPEFLVALAKKEQLKVDYEKLERDITNEAYADEVKQQNAKAEELITGTPTLFINGVKFEDFSNYGALKKLIDKEAGKAK